MAWKLLQIAAVFALFGGTLAFGMLFSDGNETTEIFTICGLALGAYGMTTFLLAIPMHPVSVAEKWSGLLFLGLCLLGSILLLRGGPLLGLRYAPEFAAASMTLFCAATMRNLIENLAISKAPRDIPDQTISCVAVHEAGHILATAIASHGPGFCGIRAELAPAESWAYGVVSMDSAATASRVIDARLKMLLAMAGQQAEISVFGFGSNGCVSDQARYMELASFWLCANGLKDSPENIRAMMDHDRSALDNFFRVNRKLLLDLAICLKNNSVMESEEIASYLGKVKPEGECVYETGL